MDQATHNKIVSFIWGIADDVLLSVINEYTREAGVRNLERQIGAICRKSVVRIVGQQWSHGVVTEELVREQLKKEKFEAERSEQIEIPGIATGLAVTAVGGDILFIEATRMKGKGHLTLTGQLGDVMRESAQIAHSFVRSKADQLGISADLFETTDVHLHVPAGAIPKDGPSAGVTMATALVSALAGRPARNDVAMTGEITLSGRVLPIGGVKEKVLGAVRAGITAVVLPKANEADLEDLPAESVAADLYEVDAVDARVRIVDVEYVETRKHALDGRRVREAGNDRFSGDGADARGRGGRARRRGGDGS